jgi:uncharacterized protein DUF4846
MQRNILISIILPFFAGSLQIASSCRQGNQTNIESATVYGDKHSPSTVADNPYPTVGMIPTPVGYHRVLVDTNYFDGWLRNCPLKKNRTVYLFNGNPKANQEAQYAVLNISVGKTDLQQCADAIMRLRAEFLYARRNFNNIDFYTEQNNRLNFSEWANGKRFRLNHGQLVPHTGMEYCEDRSCFMDYLQTVFAYCGTRSLEKQLIPVSHYQDMHIGDILIHGGSPGHAMLVIDMAEDRWGHKIYLLAQGYMPAQDIHIVKNIYNSSLSPWYSIDEPEPSTADNPSMSDNRNTPAGGKKIIYTPEWTFYSNELRTWPKLVGKL